MTTVRRGWSSIIHHKPFQNTSMRCYAAQPATDNTTHFGFRTVPEDNKEEMGSSPQHASPYNQWVMCSPRLQESTIP